MPQPERQNEQDHQPDANPAAQTWGAESTHDKLMDSLREVNSLGSAKLGRHEPISLALHASRPAAPDGIVADKNSYLDVAVHKVVDPLTKGLGGSQATCDEVTFYTKSFLKTAPLFMNGKAAVTSLALMYVADEAKPRDSFSTQAADATLGLGKGLLLAGSLAGMRQRNLTPALTAVGLGVSNRAIETGLTRSNYYDSTGHLDIGKGLLETGKTTFNPVSLAIDGTSFIMADGLWGRWYSRSRGTVRFDSVITHSLTAGTYGAATGMESEAYRQWKQGKLDLGLLGKRTVEQGAVSLLAGSLGGLQTRSSIKLEAIDAPDALEKARNNPYQRGVAGLDSRQTALRDGTFVEDKRGVNLTTETMFGRVVGTDGQSVPAVFRPHDGSEAFAQRMQAEIANYDLNKMIGYKNSSPVTVAKTVVIDGQPRPGYVQEMTGENLYETLKGAAEKTQGASTRPAMLRALRANPDLMAAFKESMVERMVAGEWDNHGQNQTVAEAAGKVEIPSIDMGDALKPAQTAHDLVPLPGNRYGWEGLNSSLYRALAGKPIGEATRSKLADFIKTSETDAGHYRLQSMGLTDQQSAGAIARAQWFVENGNFPFEPESRIYPWLALVKRKIMGRSP